MRAQNLLQIPDSKFFTKVGMAPLETVRRIHIPITRVVVTRMNTYCLNKIASYYYITRAPQRLTFNITITVCA